MRLIKLKRKKGFYSNWMGIKWYSSAVYTIEGREDITMFCPGKGYWVANRHGKFLCVGKGTRKRLMVVLKELGHI